MKFFFKFLLPFLISIQSWGRPVVLVTYNTHAENAKTVFRLLQTELNLPRELIELEWKESPCRPEKEAIAHICLNEEGELKFPVMKYQIIHHNLRDFYTANEWELINEQK